MSIEDKPLAMYDTFRSQDGKLLPVIKRHNYPRGTDGGTGVCVSAVGSYFGITPDTYKYLWSYKTGSAILIRRIRKEGYSVKDMTKKWGMRSKTAISLQQSLEIWSHIPEDAKIMVVTTSHIFVLDHNGNKACDTLSGKRGLRSKIREVHLIHPK